MRRTWLGVAARLLAAPASASLIAMPQHGFAQNAGGGADRLEEIVVTSSRIEMPLRQVGTAMSVVSGEDIELRGYTSVADVLRTQPGITVSEAGGIGKTTTLRIRGEESYRTTVFIDGVRLADPTGPQILPSFDHLLTTRDLSRVEVLRGPQGFVYGADAGGVVNILTRRGQGGPSGQLSLEAGGFDTRRYDAGVSGGGERGDYFVDATGLASDGFNSQTADTVLRDDDGYRNRTVHTKLGWNAGENLRLELVARDVDARSEYDTCGFPTIHDCLATSSQRTYRASATLDAGRLGNLFAYGTTDASNDNLVAGMSAFATEGSLSRAEYTGSYKPGGTLTFVYGLDLQREETESEGERRTRDQNAVYFEYQGQLSPRLFVSAGARRDDNEDFGAHTSSRVTAAYVKDLGRGTSIKYRASVGTGFRAPSLYEIAYDKGPFAFPPASQVTLSEETSAGYDLGIDFSAHGGLALGVTYFNQKIEDEIEFDLTTFSGYLQSQGTSRSRGVEVALDVPVAKRWGFSANLTYDDTEDAAGRERLRRPREYGNLGARYASPGEKLKVLANYRFSRNAVDEVFGLGRVPLDDYGVLDVSASYTINDTVEVHVRAQNLADEDYQELLGYNTSGRTFWAGVGLEF